MPFRLGSRIRAGIRASFIVLVDQSTAIAKYADPETTAIFIVGWSEVIRIALAKLGSARRKVLHKEGQGRGKTEIRKEALKGSIENTHNWGRVSACGKNLRVQVTVATG